MPVFGWMLGETFKNQIIQADHWIAFGLLSILGIKMIQEGTVPVDKKKIKNPLKWSVLISLSLATSIDAFAVGIGFAFFLDQIYMAAILIAIVTFLVSISGIYMGRKLGKKMAGIAEILGGIILLLIGVKILVEHLYFQ